MASAIADAQRGWHQGSAMYSRDSEPLSSAERAAWAAVLDVSQYPSDVQAHSVPDVDAVEFFFTTQGKSKYKYLASVRVGLADRLWSQRQFPSQGMRKTSSRLSALKLLATTTTQHFIHYKSGQRSAAVLARLKMLTGLDNLNTDEAIYAVSDACVNRLKTGGPGLPAPTSNPDSLRAINLRNATFNSIGVRVGSSIAAVMEFLTDGETNTDIAAGLKRLRRILEGTAEALLAVGVVRIPKDPSRLTKDQRTKLWGFRVMLKMQGLLLSAATFKEADNAKSENLTRWIQSYYQLVGAALQMMKDYRTEHNQQEDEFVNKAIVALEALGYGRSSGGAAAAGPSTSSASPTASTPRPSYFVPLKPPGPTAPPSASASAPAPSLASPFTVSPQGASSVIVATPPRQPATSSSVGAHGRPSGSPSSRPSSQSPASRRSLSKSPSPTTQRGRSVSKTPTQRSPSQQSPQGSPSSARSTATAASLSSATSPTGGRRHTSSLPGPNYWIPLRSPGPSGPPASSAPKLRHSSSVGASAVAVTSASSFSSGESNAYANDESIVLDRSWHITMMPKTLNELKICVEGQPGDKWTKAETAFLPNGCRCSSIHWKEGLCQGGGSMSGMFDGFVKRKYRQHTNAFGDVVLAALTCLPDVRLSLANVGSWADRYLQSQLFTQKAFILLVAFSRFYSRSACKHVCAMNVMRAVAKLPDTNGVRVRPHYAGSARHFLQHLWFWLVRLVHPALYDMCRFATLERRRCLDCGHTEDVRGPKAMVKTLYPVEETRKVRGFFTRQRTETRRQAVSDLQDLITFSCSDQLLFGGQHPCSKCGKLGTSWGTSTAVDMPPILFLHFRALPSEDLPKRVKLPAGRVDLGTLFGCGPSMYQPAAYILHRGSDLHNGHHTAFMRRDAEGPWYFLDDWTGEPSQKVSAGVLENEESPTRGRPLLMLFQRERPPTPDSRYAAGPAPTPRTESSAFIVTQAHAADDDSYSRAPKPGVHPGNSPVPLVSPNGASTYTHHFPSRNTSESGSSSRHTNAGD